MVSTKARHICTEGLTNKFQESCSEISPDLWWSMDPNKPWGVDSGNLSGSNVVFFHKSHPEVCFDVPSKVSHIITHFLPTLTCSCLRWWHQIAHLVFAWRSFFYYMFSSFSMAIFRPRKRIIGPLPHAAAGLEASLWRWYPRGARWANACSSGPMAWGVL
jgi:hypothetical protein